MVFLHQSDYLHRRENNNHIEQIKTLPSDATSIVMQISLCAFSGQQESQIIFFFPTKNIWTLFISHIVENGCSILHIFSFPLPYTFAHTQRMSLNTHVLKGWANISSILRISVGCTWMHVQTHIKWPLPCTNCLFRLF